METNLARAGNKRIRIASKSIRCVQAMRLVLDYDQQFEGVMAYNAAEALMLSKQGFKDVLLGYPVVNKSWLKAIAEASKQGAYICLMADSYKHLQLAQEAAVQTGAVLPVCIDLDVSDSYPGLHFGVWRSSIMQLDQLNDLLDKLSKMPQLRLEGLMGYEAQVAGVPDAAPGGGLKNSVISLLKKRSVNSVAKRRAAAVQLINDRGLELSFVNGGGTGSFESTRAETCVTEVTLGSGLYQSHLFDYYRNFELQAALFYALEIVRQPQPDIYTCYSGGYTASGSVGPLKAPKVYLPETGYLDKLEGAGEVQTPIRFRHLTEDLDLGDPILMRHAKAGELLERFNELFFLEDGKLTAVKTYRGDGYNFG